MGYRASGCRGLQSPLTAEREGRQQRTTKMQPPPVVDPPPPPPIPLMKGVAADLFQDVNISPMARADPHVMDMPVEHTPSPLGLPTSAHLAAGNGGEHGHPCDAVILTTCRTSWRGEGRGGRWGRGKLGREGGGSMAGGRQRQGRGGGRGSGWFRGRRMVCVSYTMVCISH